MDYFTFRATEALTKAKASDANPSAIASWARDAHAVGDRKPGIIVDSSGAIHATTRRAHDTHSGITVHRINEWQELGLKLNILDMGMASLSRIVGRPLIHLTYAELATGPGQKVAADVASLREAAQSLSDAEDAASHARARRDVLIRQQAEDGVTMYAIAKALGISQQAVKKIVMAADD